MHAQMRLPRGERGFSLVEVIVATAIAAIAVVGLAYTFSSGRAFINRFELARAGLAAANGRLERLSVLDPFDAALSPDSVHQANFEVGGQVLGLERWTVTPYDDPADGAAGSDRDGNTEDLMRIDLTVAWPVGSMEDSLSLYRLVSP